MKKMVLLSVFISSLAFGAIDGKDYAQKNGISASSKASAQWDRNFEKDREPFDKLTNAEDKKSLLDYLKKHAADSNTPEAAGM